MQTYSRRHALTLGAGALALTAIPVNASTARVAVNDAGVAIDGYDTTAYWRSSAAHIGTAEHVVTWRGTPWQFATAQDAALFAATPDAFAPQFGGFCTRAMSFKKVVNGDPEVWRIYLGKLYLFARPVGGTKFDAGQDAMIASARAYWDSLA